MINERAEEIIDYYRYVMGEDPPSDWSTFEIEAYLIEMHEDL